MKLIQKLRVFEVNGVSIKDYGKITLEENDMVSFVTENGKEYDFVAKEWGFYASPSINDRLVREGFKVALVTNTENKIFMMVVDENKIHSFEDYLINDNQKVICWLDEWFK
jgi:hypothetical protein